MTFTICGLNHKTAPLAVREQMAIALPMQAAFLENLLKTQLVEEAIVLSTCNRTEIYCISDQPENIMPWVLDYQGLNLKDISPCVYLLQDQDAMQHALRVASGLDSMMIGEPQILGQIKHAYQQGLTLGCVKQKLRPVFEYLFQASKRVRHTSGIGANPVSIAFAAAQLVQQFFPDHSKLTIFLIGSGETAALVAKYLHQQGVAHFMVASRTQDHAQHLATQFGGQALSIADIPDYLAKADVIISATACPLPFITKSMVDYALSLRNHNPMFFLDLAVPRDIEPNVADLAHVQLYNIDDLHSKIAIGKRERQVASQQAEILINQELEHYLNLHKIEQSKDIICQYRTQMKTMADEELTRALQRLTNGDDQASVLAEFGLRLFNKLTHPTTVGFRQAALDNKLELLDLAQYFFNLRIAVAHETIS